MLHVAVRCQTNATCFAVFLIADPVANESQRVKPVLKQKANANRDWAVSVCRASFKDFSVEGSTTKGTSGKKGKVERCTVWGVWGSSPKKIFVFLSSPDLISCNFSMIFAHFQIKRDFY